jgi:nucleotide-binding universal stress UspA family protein
VTGPQCRRTVVVGVEGSDGRTAELLVVGAPRHRAPARLGSTTPTVVHRATCPVAVVPVDDVRGAPQ